MGGTPGRMENFAYYVMQETKAALRGSGAAWQEEERLAKAVSAVRKPV